MKMEFKQTKKKTSNKTQSFSEIYLNDEMRTVKTDGHNETASFYILQNQRQLQIDVQFALFLVAVVEAILSFCCHKNRWILNWHIFASLSWHTIVYLHWRQRHLLTVSNRIHIYTGHSQLLPFEIFGPFQ